MRPPRGCWPATAEDAPPSCRAGRLGSARDGRDAPRRGFRAGPGGFRGVGRPGMDRRPARQGPGPFPRPADGIRGSPTALRGSTAPGRTVPPRTGTDPSAPGSAESHRDQGRPHRRDATSGRIPGWDLLGVDGAPSTRGASGSATGGGSGDPRQGSVGPTVSAGVGVGAPRGVGVGDAGAGLPVPGLLHPIAVDGADPVVRGPDPRQQGELRPPRRQPGGHRGLPGATGFRHR